MKTASLIVCAVFATAPAFATGRTLDISAAYSLASAVKTFPDPLYVGEHDYVSSAAQQARVIARGENFFAMPLQMAYQGLSIKSASRSAQGNLYHSDGYFSSFLQLSTAIDTGIFRWHFGLAALVTFTTRSRYDEASGRGVSEPAIDTALSQAYPSGGFTLFPKAPIRFSVLFLPGDAHLLYGWLRIQAEFETGRHTFTPSVELLNHSSFGKGLPNFVQPPGAFVMGYAVRFEQAKFFTRAGFVLNATQGFNSARVSFTDRLLLEFGIGYSFAL